jgi:drug/metabolite transporter (DMT)-like permease
VSAVFFGALAGALFGALAVAVRYGLQRGGDPEVGAVVVGGVSLAVSVLVAIPSVVIDEVRPADLWPFLLIGGLVPGASQILFILAIRDAGPSRASILIGTAPLMSVAIALVLLGEPFRPLIVLGTALVVAGGAALARERSRPEHFRAIGATLALVCAGLFAVRDNVARWAARGTHPPPLVATAVALLGAFAVILATCSWRGARPYARGYARRSPPLRPPVSGSASPTPACWWPSTGGACRSWRR